MMVELIGRLVDLMNQGNLRYCHWKSNFSLADTLSGATDLDILIDRKSMSKMLIILLRLGFKSARTKSGTDPEGILHYYGLDSGTGRLVHVHLFIGILTGESFVKSHLLPFEDMLLDNTTSFGELKVASPAAELVVFIVRTFIKYGSLLDILVLVRKPAIIRDELTWLQNKGDLPLSLELLRKYCPVLNEALFLNCLDALKANASLPKRIFLALKVRRYLRIYAKYTFPGMVLAYSKYVWSKGLGILDHRKNRKSLDGGGAVIAFVGAEATGKSTLVSETAGWLSQIFSTRTIHAGKPPSTWITAPLNILLPLLRRFLPRLRTTRQEGSTNELSENNSSPTATGWLGLVYAIRSASLAWDRRQLLVKAHNHAANGDIVICDRYPSENFGTMDSPRLQKVQEIAGFRAVMYNWLASREHRFYKEIPPPDMVLKLNVSMEVARQRNRDRIKADKESDTYLEARHRQSRDWCLSGTKYIFDVDTGQSLANTILAVKQSTWEVI